MTDFLSAFTDLLLYVLQLTGDWDNVIVVLPIVFVILSMLVLIFRKVVFV